MKLKLTMTNANRRGTARGDQTWTSMMCFGRKTEEGVDSRL